MKYRDQLKNELRNVMKLRRDVAGAFVWDQTSQGFDYWFNVYAELVNVSEDLERQLEIMDEHK